MRSVEVPESEWDRHIMCDTLSGPAMATKSFMTFRSLSRRALAVYGIMSCLKSFSSMRMERGTRPLWMTKLRGTLAPATIASSVALRSLFACFLPMIELRDQQLQRIPFALIKSQR